MMNILRLSGRSGEGCSDLNKDKAKRLGMTVKAYRARADDELFIFSKARFYDPDEYAL